MPYTPTTPTIVLCDGLVSALEAAWSPVAPSGVERAYFVRLGDGEDGSTRLDGRRVVVFPTRYGLQAETRGEDGYTHEVTVLAAERYPDAGDPTRDWLDERVDWVHEQVVKGFDFGRDGPPAWNPMLYTLSADVQVLDLEKLLGGGKLFYAVVEFQFLELVSP